jgi:hypothetical protein
MLFLVIFFSVYMACSSQFCSVFGYVMHTVMIIVECVFDYSSSRMVLNMNIWLSLHCFMSFSIPIGMIECSIFVLYHVFLHVYSIFVCVCMFLLRALSFLAWLLPTRASSHHSLPYGRIDDVDLYELRGLRGGILFMPSLFMETSELLLYFHGASLPLILILGLLSFST